MAREIKFRAWDSVAEVMYYSDEDADDFAFVCEDGELKCYSIIDEPATQDEPEHPSAYLLDTPLMQYTGLKDKNGKDIYEGDVVRDEFDRCDVVGFGRIGYDGKWNGLSGFGLSNTLTKDPDVGEFYELDYYDQPASLEVIGNIYENPDLLK